MYVCIYVCMYVCMYVCIYIYIYIYICMHTHMHVHIYTHRSCSTMGNRYVIVGIFEHLDTYIHWACMHACIATCIRAYIHTYVPTYPSDLCACAYARPVYAKDGKHMPFLYVYAHAEMHVCVLTPVFLSICLSIHPSVFVSLCLSIHLST